MNLPSTTRGRPHPVWWIIALSLAAIAMSLIFDHGGVEQVLAQPVRSSGARGIFAFTGPISPTEYGVFLVDVDSGTLWCYEFVTDKGVKKLRLLSGRSWIFDRYLEDYNVQEPSVEVIKELVSQQRSRLQTGGSSGAP